MPDFLPHREADLLTWSINFNTLIGADPTAYGLDVAQAGDYATLHTAYANAYQTANQDGTRTPASIVTKNNAKQALIAEARELAAIIQAFPGTTDTERADLQITVPDPEPTPVPEPTTAPGIEIIWAVGRQVRIRLRDVENPDSRAKPEGVVSAAVMTFLGPAPPAPEDVAAWKFEGITTRTLTTIQFDASVPTGTTAWLTAVWYNTRGDSGPPSAPISTQIPGSLPAAA